MRYRELTTPELEHRWEQLIARSRYRQRVRHDALQNAIRRGIARADAQYVADLMPGRAAKRARLQRRAAMTNAGERQQTGGS